LRSGDKFFVRIKVARSSNVKTGYSTRYISIAGS